MPWLWQIIHVHNISRISWWGTQSSKSPSHPFLLVSPFKLLKLNVWLNWINNICMCVPLIWTLWGSIWWEHVLNWGCVYHGYGLCEGPLIWTLWGSIWWEHVLNQGCVYHGYRPCEGPSGGNMFWIEDVCTMDTDLVRVHLVGTCFELRMCVPWIRTLWGSIDMDLVRVHLVGTCFESRMSVPWIQTLWGSIWWEHVLNWGCVYHGYGLCEGPLIWTLWGSIWWEHVLNQGYVYHGYGPCEGPSGGNMFWIKDVCTMDTDLVRVHLVGTCFESRMCVMLTVELRGRFGQ